MDIIGGPRVSRLLLHGLHVCIGRLSALERRLGPLAIPEHEQQARVGRAMTRYDMVSHPDEPYYRRQYWHWIEDVLDRMDPQSIRVCLDLGCGQGRLTIPLAQKLPRAHILAVDLSEAAVTSATEYSAQAGVQNISYQVHAIRDALRAQDSGSVDVALMTEVSFFHPGWRTDLGEIARVLRPDGVLFAAFRPQYYDALRIVQKGLWRHVDMLLSERSGPLYGGALNFTWQTSTEIRRLLADELHMEVHALVGIGCCSGTEEDPHGLLARPSRLEPEEQQALMRLELAIGADLPDAGRYMLAIARKRADAPARRRRRSPAD